MGMTPAPLGISYSQIQLQGGQACAQKEKMA